MTATGENDKVGPVNYLTYHLEDTLPNTMAHLSQTFLGARIGCAQCHDHPFDKWSQADFWGFASFLANTRSDRVEDPWGCHLLCAGDRKVHCAGGVVIGGAEVDQHAARDG